MIPVNIGQGHVYHSRKEGAANQFRYPTFFIFFRCDQEAELQRILKSKYKGLLSFSAKGYLKNNEDPLNDQVTNFLRDFCDYQADEVWLHTMPSMFGYSFNPVNFWLCRRNGKLEAVLTEVNNTFGERHFYWINPKQEIKSDQWLRAEKVFHVSPFFPVTGYYQFRFQINDFETRVDINYHDPEGPLRLATWVSGQMTPLQNQSRNGLLFKYGWITVMVVLRIHYQAMKLWIKRSRFYRKPALPRQEVSS